MKKLNGIEKFILIILLGVFIFASWKIASILMEYHAASSYYKELRKEYAPDMEEEEPEDIQATSPKIPKKKIDFKSLQELNPDIKGWIYIPDTHIDYPVLQTDNNDFYLHHLYDGNYNYSGSIFMDKTNTFLTNDNTILYGHHMKDGSMFRDLMNYQEEDFYKKHPYAFLYTPDGNYLIEIFAGFTTEHDGNAYNIDFANKEDYQACILDWKSQSDFKSEITPGTEDKCITLSTCAYSFKNARYVLIGRFAAKE